MVKIIHLNKNTENKTGLGMIPKTFKPITNPISTIPETEEEHKDSKSKLTQNPITQPKHNPFKNLKSPFVKHKSKMS